MKLFGYNIGMQIKRQSLNLHYFDSSLRITRVGLILGIVLYSLFGLFDPLLLPQSYQKLFWIRYLIVLPGLVLCFCLTYVKKVNRFNQLISFCAMLIGFSGMLICMYYGSSDPAIQFVYFTGLILLVSFGPMLLALNTFFTVLSISIAIIVFVLFINQAACVDSNYLACTIFLEQLAFLLSAGLLGSIIQFFITKLQQKEKNNLLKITRKKNQLEQYSKKLKNADEVKNKLLSIISHDIKGPLASIRGILYLYSTDMISNQEFKDHSKKLELLLSSTGNLLDNLLFWSIYQGSKTPLSLKQSKIFDLVTENFNLYHFVSQNKSTKLINKVDESLSIAIDKTLINLVLRNLISNAVKFTENGNIMVYTKLMDSTLSIIVEDTGTGMSVEQIDRIYEWNERNSISGTRNEKGTGIGLIICKEFIEKHGGRLRVESRLSEGTKIAIELPQQKKAKHFNTGDEVEYELSY